MFIEQLDRSIVLGYGRIGRPTRYALGPGPDGQGDRDRLFAYCAAALATAGIDAL
ncbi:MAG TPA: hypothetical protein VMJ65_06225 [Solirubrobacteraceae bacterium]|nr:hypothetical protein [Solirubrobacteraceae bacterium]